MRLSDLNEVIDLACELRSVNNDIARLGERAALVARREYLIKRLYHLGVTQS